MTTTPRKAVGSLAGLLALALLAGGARAAQVRVQGATASQSRPTPDVLDLGKAASTELTLAGSFRGVLSVESQLDGARQTMRVVLSDVSLTTSGKSDELVRMSIVQDFAARLGSHVLGNTPAPPLQPTTTPGAGPKPTAEQESMAFAHGLALPNTADILDKDPMAPSGNGLSAVSLVQLRDGLFRLTATYQFAISRGTTSGAFLRDEKDGALGQVVLVPLPPAAWAGLGGLALVAGSNMRRRRNVR